MSEQTTNTEGHTFQRWYLKNGGKLNQSRREKYATDPEYREKVKAASLRTKRRRKERGGVAETTVTRLINGKEVEMYRVSAAAEIIEKSPDTIRLWCRKGWIPDPGDEGEHRLYTKPQIKLLLTLRDTIAEYRYQKKYKKVLAACVAHIAKKW